MRRRGERGFSVIEALVAVAVVAIALTALASLQAQVSRAAAQQQTLQHTLAAERNALAILRDLNIMDAPEGSSAMASGATIRWSAQPISDRRRTTNGRFDVVLYAVDIEISGAGAGAPTRLSIEQLGWREVASASTGHTAR